MPINSFLYPAKNVPTGYEVANSLRFNDDDNARLSKTLGTATNRDKYTLSVWVKRSTLGANSSIFTCYGNGSQKGTIRFDSTDKISAYLLYDGGWHYVQTSAVFRDVSAWYNIILAVDTTQATDTNRIKLYVNGSLATIGAATYPSQNEDTWFNAATEHQIGSLIDETEDFDGYMAEFVFIDGQQLDPTSFGEFDSDSPTIWKPIDVSGLTFGNNGFYLDFENASSLGADVSGNSNNFTVNNLTSVDQSTDTCTNNFATFNSLSKNDSGTVTFSEGNLQTAHSGSDSRFNSYSTIGVSSGKWYAEVKYEGKSSNSQNDLIVGVAYDVEDLNRQGSGIGGSSGSFAYVGDNGTKLHDSSESSYGSTFTTGDVIGIFLDLDNHKLYFSKNGSVVASGDPTSGSSGTNAAFSLDTGETYFICAGHGTSTSRETTYSMNFGSPIGSISSGNQDPNGYGNFEYSPQGYYALNSKNLAEFG
jgi:hypothetical protein